MNRKQLRAANRTVDRIGEWAEKPVDLKDDQPASRNPFAVNSKVNRWLRGKVSK